MNVSVGLSGRAHDLASSDVCEGQPRVAPWRHLRPYSRDTGVLESRGRDHHPMAWRLAGAPAGVPPDTCCARCGEGLHPSAGDWMYDDPAPAYLCASCAGILLAQYRSG